MPLERDDAETERVMQEARVPQDGFLSDGFLFVRWISSGPWGKFRSNGERIEKDRSIFIVQSVSTGEIFINKLMEEPWDPQTGRSIRPPLELRVSTYRHQVGDPNIDLPGNHNGDVHRKGVLSNVPYFNKLRFWQELDPYDRFLDCTVYSLFFE